MISCNEDKDKFVMYLISKVTLHKSAFENHETIFVPGIRRDFFYLLDYSSLTRISKCGDWEKNNVRLKIFESLQVLFRSMALSMR